jgi:hypothetical protein
VFRTKSPEQRGRPVLIVPPSPREVSVERDETTSSTETAAKHHAREHEWSGGPNERPTGFLFKEEDGEFRHDSDVMDFAQYRLPIPKRGKYSIHAQQRLTAERLAPKRRGRP